MIRLLLFMALLCPVLRAEETGVSISLISEQSTIQAGEAFTVGLHLEHEEGYHTYWEHPGIVGIATSLKWKLPEGFHASEIQWPHPTRGMMAVHPCFSYERDVTLLVTITPPAKILTPEVELRARASWMCCADSCHPGSKSLSLTLPVGDEAKADPAQVKRFQTARAEIPKPSKDWSAKLLSAKDADPIVVQLRTLSGERPLDLFSRDGQFTSTAKVEIRPDGAKQWQVKLERSEYSPKGANKLPFVLRSGEAYFELAPRVSK
ncbi:MAG: protein-disulfide reductase DsbD domain-containing protein [Verrucomicrobiota bacterium]